MNSCNPTSASVYVEYEPAKPAGTPTSLSGPLPKSTLTEQQQQLIGVPRWPSSRFNRESSPSQRMYGLSFWQASRKAGADIAKREVHSFNELWQQATLWRCNAASKDQREYKWKRTSVYKEISMTPLEGATAYIRCRFQNREAVQTHDFGDVYGTFLEFPLTRALMGKEITLSTVTLNTNLKAERNKHPFSPIRNTLYSQPFYILHTHPDHIPEVMEHVEKLYNLAINPKLTTQSTLAVIADIHWWVANAKPDSRGNAAKTEFAIRAIAQAKGIELGPMKHGTLVNLEAMTTPRKTFIDRYHEMFEETAAYEISL